MKKVVTELILSSYTYLFLRIQVAYIVTLLFAFWISITQSTWNLLMQFKNPAVSWLFLDDSDGINFGEVVYRSFVEKFLAASH